MNKRQKGGMYEAAAAAFLQQRGFQILEQNFWCRQGEIDLICRHQGYLVFAEVKYRSDTSFGFPEEAVDGRKQKRIRAAAAYYLYSKKLGADTPCRFDVIHILGNQMELIEDAF